MDIGDAAVARARRCAVRIFGISFLRAEGRRGKASESGPGVPLTRLLLSLSPPKERGGLPARVGLLFMAHPVFSDQRWIRPLDSCLAQLHVR